MSEKHARDQVLDYFAKIFAAATGLVVDVHRIGLAEAIRVRHIEISIEDEVIGGDDEADEADAILEKAMRVAPMVARITVKRQPGDTDPPNVVANTIGGHIERAAMVDGSDLAGIHIFDPPDSIASTTEVDCQYTGMTSAVEDELEAETAQIELIFSTSYFTSIRDPFQLI